MYLLEEMQQSFLAVLVDFKPVPFVEDKLLSTRNLSGCPWQVVSSELSHRQDNALLNHAFFLEQLGFHWELSSQVLTGHDFDLCLRSNTTAIHSAAALALPRPCPSFHQHCGSISFVSPYSPTSGTPCSLDKWNQLTQHCWALHRFQQLSPNITPFHSHMPQGTELATTATRDQTQSFSSDPSSEDPALRDSPGFPQSAHNEFSALLHTSLRAFMLLSPPAMVSNCHPLGQCRCPCLLHLRCTLREKEPPAGLAGTRWEGRRSPEINGMNMQA